MATLIASGMVKTCYRYFIVPVFCISRTDWIIRRERLINGKMGPQRLGVNGYLCNCLYGNHKCLRYSPCSAER
jgi:hypothetical protein